MPPPANNTAATATLISTFPYTHTQTDVWDGAATYDAWYKFVAPTDAVVMSIWGYSGDNNPVGYWPHGKPYSDAGITQILAIDAQNVPFYIPVTPGNTYWIKFQASFSVLTTGLQVKVEVHDPETVDIGDIIVNSDQAGFPLVFFSSTTDYTVKKFISPFPAGEGGDILTSGISCWEDISTHGVKIFDSTFVQTYSSGDLRVSGAASSHIYVRRNAGSNNFWVIVNEAAQHSKLRKLTSAGVLGSPVEINSWSNIAAFCVDSAESLMYYWPGPGEDIRIWSIAGATDTGVFASVAGPFPDDELEDLFILSDGIVVYIGLNSSDNHTWIRTFSSGGSHVASYDLGVSAVTVPRGAWAVDNPNSIWVMDHSSRLIYHYNVRISDGVVLRTRTNQMFSGGVYNNLSTSTPTTLYGQANSCPFVIMHVAGEEEPPPEEPPSTPPNTGIHVLVPIPSPPDTGGGGPGPLPPDNPPGAPGIPPGSTGVDIPPTRHDTYPGGITKKIPNPTVRTALFGE